MKRLASIAAILITVGSGERAAAERERAGPVAQWERLVEGAYENKGIAQIGRLGSRWVLTVNCNGVHTTYLDDTPIDLSRYREGYVTARYHYVDRTIDDARCVREPCSPVLERRIAIETLTIVSGTVEAAREMARSCGTSHPAAK